jgi:formylglycine-generating enzyme required for sulfatase activity
MADDREPGFTWPDRAAPRPFKPAQYVVHRTVDPITVDGDLRESSWAHAAWTDGFGPILLPGYLQPFLATRAKLLWDDDCLYAAAELEEPNLVGHVVTRDEEIYRDNDIELFIDVDGDGQDYIELEFNCLGTIWDMLLPKEYNRGGRPFSHPRIEDSPPWDLEGMRVAVRLDGSLNYPLDTDRGWTIEIAMPWESLQATSRTGAPLKRPGTTMRLNVSRVQHTWPRVFPIVDWTDRGPASYDWTWSQQLVYNMHCVETWGRVLLSQRRVTQAPDPDLVEAFPFVATPPAPHTVEPGEMVRVAAGSYPVGPDETDPEASPAGQVHLSAFDIDRYPVTVGQYARFLNAGGGDEHWRADMEHPDLCGIRRDGQRFVVVDGRDLYPMTLVAIEDARAWASWAGKRLPTEVEWEAAARGKEGRRFPWGDDSLSDERANYDFRVGHPTIIGSYEAGQTPEGIHDLAGNVWELCDERWRPYEWQGPAPDPWTAGWVTRGGSWVTPAANMAASYRGAHKGICGMAGFRCVRDVT